MTNDELLKELDEILVLNDQILEENAALAKKIDTVQSLWKYTPIVVPFLLIAYLLDWCSLRIFVGGSFYSTLFLVVCCAFLVECCQEKYQQLQARLRDLESRRIDATHSNSLWKIRNY